MGVRHCLCVCVCVSGAACEAAGTILGTGSIGSRHKNTDFPVGHMQKLTKTRDIKMRSALPNGCRTGDTLCTWSDSKSCDARLQFLIV